MEATEKKEITQGDILSSSWGYEQTNVDYYLVLCRKNSTVTLQAIGQERTYDCGMSGKCTPDVNVKIGDIFRKRISKYSSIRIDECRRARLWSGKPMYWSSWA